MFQKVPIVQFIGMVIKLLHSLLDCKVWERLYWGINWGLDLFSKMDCFSVPEAGNTLLTVVTLFSQNRCTSQIQKEHI